MKELYANCRVVATEVALERGSHYLKRALERHGCTIVTMAEPEPYTDPKEGNLYLLRATGLKPDEVTD